MFSLCVSVHRGGVLSHNALQQSSPPPPPEFFLGIFFFWHFLGEIFFVNFFFSLKKAGGAGGMPLAVTQEDCLVLLCKSLPLNWTKKKTYRKL